MKQNYAFLSEKKDNYKVQISIRYSMSELKIKDKAVCFLFLHEKPERKYNFLKILLISGSQIFFSCPHFWN